MKKFISVILLIVILNGVTLTISADEPPRHHKHFITLSNGQVVEVGPNVCEMTFSHDGWHKFHSQMHRGIPGGILDITIEFCD